MNDINLLNFTYRTFFKFKGIERVLFFGQKVIILPPTHQSI